MVVRYESVLPVLPEEVWQFHAAPDVIQQLTPAGRKLEVVGAMPLKNGALHVLRFRLGPLSLEWHARISEVDPPFGFTDTAEQSPFRRWVHRHRFEPHPEGCLLVDEIDFDMPLGPLGRLTLPFVKRDIDRTFAFRHAQTVRSITSAAGSGAR